MDYLWDPLKWPRLSPCNLFIYYNTCLSTSLFSLCPSVGLKVCHLSVCLSVYFNGSDFSSVLQIYNCHHAYIVHYTYLSHSSSGLYDSFQHYCIHFIFPIFLFLLFFLLLSLSLSLCLVSFRFDLFRNLSKRRNYSEKFSPLYEQRF